MTWSDGDAIKLWSVDGELLDSLANQGVKQAWFSTDGGWIVAAGGDRKRKLAWSLDLDYLQRQGCGLLRLRLTNPTLEAKHNLCRTM
jgi:hypothetical protein